MTRAKLPLTLAAVLALFAAPLAAADEGTSNGMKMNMPMSDAPAHFKPTRSAYTAHHLFLVKLLAVPTPIPYEKYFTIRLGIYDGAPPHKKLSDAAVEIYAGMRHGMKTGFAHGMNSSPKVTSDAGIVDVSGMYFHMMGAWTLKATVRQGGKDDVAYLQLPCCGK
jgi:hypothetical protein